LSYDKYEDVIDTNTYDNTQLYEIKDISNVFATQNGTISNCILEIPQKINAIVENNVLTLKAGSSCWYPNGNTYSEVSNSSDLTLDLPTNTAKFVVCMSFAGSSLFARNILSCVSGSGATASGGFAFDTSAQTIINYSGTGEAGGRYCAPLCVIDVVDGVASFAKDSNGRDMIFNGAGFIGHHAFVYPGIKALVSDRYNTNGNLKSRQTITNSLQIVELGGTGTSKDWYVRLFSNGIISNGRYREYNTIEDVDVTGGVGCYIKNQNAVITANTLAQTWYTPLINFAGDGTAVTDFTIQQPFRLGESKNITYRQW